MILFNSNLCNNFFSYFPFFQSASGAIFLFQYFLFITFYNFQWQVKIQLDKSSCYGLFHRNWFHILIFCLGALWASSFLVPRYGPVTASLLTGGKCIFLLNAHKRIAGAPLDEVLCRCLWSIYKFAKFLAKQLFRLCYESPKNSRLKTVRTLNQSQDFFLNRSWKSSSSSSGFGPDPLLIQCHLFEGLKHGWSWRGFYETGQYWS